MTYLHGSFGSGENDCDFVRDEAQGIGYTIEQVGVWQPPSRPCRGRGRS
jgi:hypothetical protein